jgi:hypothetical protein
MRHAIDVTSRVSAELSELLQKMVDDPDGDESPTLGAMRALLTAKSGRARIAEEALHPQDRTSLIVELDDLIEEYGEEALAIDFVAVKASEVLSRVIEAAMNEPSLPEDPTLSAVRRSILDGLAARLVGEGAIEVDDDATLLQEIDDLIRRFGEDAVAQEFIRLE